MNDDKKKKRYCVEDDDEDVIDKMENNDLRTRTTIIRQAFADNPRVSITNEASHLVRTSGWMDVYIDGVRIKNCTWNENLDDIIAGSVDRIHGVRIIETIQKELLKKPEDRAQPCGTPYCKKSAVKNGLCYDCEILISVGLDNFYDPRITFDPDRGGGSGGDITTDPGFTSTHPINEVPYLLDDVETEFLSGGDIGAPVARPLDGSSYACGECGDTIPDVRVYVDGMHYHGTCTPVLGVRVPEPSKRAQLMLQRARTAAAAEVRAHLEAGRDVYGRRAKTAYKVTIAIAVIAAHGPRGSK